MPKIRSTRELFILRRSVNCPIDYTESGVRRKCNLEWVIPLKPEISKKFRCIDLFVTEESLIGSLVDSKVCESDVSKNYCVLLLEFLKPEAPKL